jgi:hypothetical protein
MRWFAFFALTIVPLSARAQGTVTFTPGPGADPLITALGIDTALLEERLEAEVAAAFNVLEPDEYLRALADAQAFSNSGLGIDYASNPTLFTAGIAAKFAVATGDEGLGEYYEDRPVGGVAPNISLMAGLNLGLVGFDWLTLYGNYFAQGQKMEQLDGYLQNFGFHAQVKFFRPEGDAAEYLFQWGGFDLSTGYEWSRLKVELTERLDTTMPLAGDATDPVTGEPINTDAVFAGIGTFNITTTASNIPFELTTNFRLLYFATLFFGVGYDVHLGSGEMEIDLSGDVTATNPLDGSEVNLGTASVTVTEEGKPSAGVFRLIAGLQLNISVVKVFVQANIAPTGTNNATAVAAGAGVRVAW